MLCWVVFYFVYWIIKCSRRLVSLNPRFHRHRHRATGAQHQINKSASSANKLPISNDSQLIVHFHCTDLSFSFFIVGRRQQSYYYIVQLLFEKQRLAECTFTLIDCQTEFSIQVHIIISLFVQVSTGVFARDHFVYWTVSVDDLLGKRRGGGGGGGCCYYCWTPCWWCTAAAAVKYCNNILQEWRRVWVAVACARVSWLWFVVAVMETEAHVHGPSTQELKTM